MKKTSLAVSAALIIAPVAAQAQEAQNNRVQVMNVEPQAAEAVEVEAVAEPAPVPAPAATTITLPANSEVVLRMAEELTTKGGQAKVGTSFRLTVVYDVKVNGVTVIPAGTPAMGEVTWRTGRAVFGKSGKMEIALRSINLDGEQIEIEGKYRQEGEGDTLAAVGAVLLAPALGVITGKSAVIPRGKVMTGHTVENVTITT